MSKYKKYVNGGSINPFWIAEQERKFEEAECNRNISISVTLDIEKDDNCLEAAFQLLKRHNDSPEDLELGIKVIEANSENK